jgi:4-amino-4-deoxy-L-arabinose transferase-like glycosyltransferase
LNGSAPHLGCPYWLGLLVVFCISLTLFTRHNSFPHTYHPDEDTKVQQVLSGKRNFFHPLLMLTATDGAMRLAQISKTPENAARTGRWISAVFTAVAVVSLTILAYRWAGWIAGVGASILLMLNPLIFELAHYFKEDPALLMGMAVSFLALDFFWKTPTARTAAFLGFGNALAVSGKYIGVVVLLFTLPFLVAHARKNGRSLAAWFMGGLLLPLFIINLPLFLDLPDFIRGLSREMTGVTGGHRGLRREVPHAFYFGRMLELTPPLLWLAFPLSVGVFLWRKSERSYSQLATFAFPVFFFALLSFSPKTAGRYLLPVQAYLAFGSALGLVCFARAASGWKKIIIVAVLAAGVWSSASITAGYFREFSTDSRSDLRVWLNENTPAEAVIAEDGRVNLEADPAWRSRKVLTSEYVPDLGSIEEMRARGVTHVAVARQAYKPYLDKNIKPKAAEKAAFERRAAFYRALFASGNPVWESPLGAVIYLRPGIRVYAVPER